MLDPKYVLENADFIVKKTKARGVKLSLDEFIKISQEKKDYLIKIESLRHEKNKASQLVSQKKKEGKDTASVISEMKKVAAEMKKLEEKLRGFKEKLRDISLSIPNVGTLGIHQFGLPGSGKSNFFSGIIQMCLKKGEFLIMPGDRFCEWRHYPFHPRFPTKIKILTPKDVDIYYHGFERNGWFESVDYEDLDIFNHVNNNQRALVIYDQHLPLWQRVRLWLKVFLQLLNRIEYVDIPFSLFFHEGGIYFDEFAEGDHWKAVKEFSQLFVEHRKALIRMELISQLESEIKSTIRGKCVFQIVRKSFLSRRYPKSLRKAAPFTRIHQYHLLYGGIYIKNNVTNKFSENTQKWKMIPQVLYQTSQKKVGKLPFGRKQCPKCQHIWVPRVASPKKCPNCKLDL